MRVKITFEHPRTKNQEKHLISVPEHLKNISDLQFHIIEKLCLGSYLQRGQFSTALTIGGYNLPKKEKIIGLVKNDDNIKYFSTIQLAYI